MALHVEIVAPESALWAGEAKALIARSSAGDFTIFAQHTATVGDIRPGLVRVQTADGEHAFTVHGGYFQIASDGNGGTRATVLAGIAEDVTTIDVARALAAKERYEAVIAAHREDDPAGLDEARQGIARAELRLAHAK
jgi:F-type H+-transporting ATPase subunit epsilon